MANSLAPNNIGDWWASFLDFFKNGDQRQTPLSTVIHGDSPYSSPDDVIQSLQKGDIDANEALRIMTKYFRIQLLFNPQYEEIIQSFMSRENTSNAQDYETWAAQNNLLWDAEQLSKLGLSSGGVLQTGGSMPNVAAAQTPTLNASVNQFNSLSHLASSLIRTAGSMANAGIYGSALKAVKGSAANAAAQAAHAAKPAARLVKKMSSKALNAHWEQTLRDIGL